MEHTPRYYITELNDEIQWLTDGQDFGINLGELPELLADKQRTIDTMRRTIGRLSLENGDLLARLKKYVQWVSDDQIRGTMPTQNERAIREDARATIKQAKGE